MSGKISFRECVIRPFDLMAMTSLPELADSFYSKAKGSLGEELRVANASDVILLGSSIEKIKKVHDAKMLEFAKYSFGGIIETIKTFFNGIFQKEEAALKDIQALVRIQKAIAERRDALGGTEKCLALFKKEEAAVLAKTHYLENKERIGELKQNRKKKKSSRRKIHKEIIKLLKEQKRYEREIGDRAALKKTKKAIKREKIKLELYNLKRA